MPRRPEDRLPCPHEESVYWNPHHNTVECHRCKEQFVSFTWTLDLLTAAKEVVRLWDAIPDTAAQHYPDQKLTAIEVQQFRDREPAAIRALRTAINKATGG